MAYKTETLFKKAKELIETNNLFFHTDVFEMLVIDVSTYYSHFPKDSKEYKAIDELLKQNRVKTKGGLRKKWFRSENATMTVALYKLIGNEDERKRLSQQYNDLTTDGDKIQPSVVIYRPEKLTDDMSEYEKPGPEQK